MSKHLATITIPVHLIAIGSLFFFTPSVVGAVLFLVAYFAFGCLGVVVGSHRYFVHRSFEATKWKRWVLGILAVMSGNGNLYDWIIVHKILHHPYADREEDPHTPRKGFRTSYMGWQNKSYASLMRVHARALVRFRTDDNFELISFLSTHIEYAILYVPILAIATLTPTLLPYYMAAILFAIHQEHVINYFCHQPSLGYASYPLKNDSRNVPLIGYLIWGEGWHNNHHHAPNLHRLELQPGEFDIAGRVIDLIRDG